MSINTYKSLHTMSTNKLPYIDELNDINYDLTHPDIMVWGVMTVDEAEASFIPGGEYYDDWGTKSYNILHNILN